MWGPARTARKKARVKPKISCNWWQWEWLEGQRELGAGNAGATPPDEAAMLAAWVSLSQDAFLNRRDTAGRLKALPRKPLAVKSCNDLSRDWDNGNVLVKFNLHETHCYILGAAVYDGHRAPFCSTFPPFCNTSGPVARRRWWLALGDGCWSWWRLLCTPCAVRGRTGRAGTRVAAVGQECANHCANLPNSKAAANQLRVDGSIPHMPCPAACTCARVCPCLRAATPGCFHSCQTTMQKSAVWHIDLRAPYASCAMHCHLQQHQHAEVCLWCTELH